MLASFDFSILLDNMEGIIALSVTLLSVVGVILQSLGKNKKAKQVKEYSEAIDAHKTNILELTDVVTTLVRGVEEADKKTTPKGKSKEGVQKIVNKKAKELGTEDLLNKAKESLSK